MWYSFVSYLKFLFKSSNQHGVHSPFVYDFITKCLYRTHSFEDYHQLKAYRNRLLKNKTQIEITDFGSGSRVFRNNKRRVNKITRHSGTSLKKAQLLYRIVDYFKSKHILELGTSMGIGTQALALNNNEAKITTIEGCGNTLSLAKQELKDSGMTTISFINSEFSEGIETLFSTHPEIKFDLIYFDGNHQKGATLQYFNSLIPTIQNDSIWIFDDIYWSKDMTSAWGVIKQHPKVTVTVDIFHFGLVFFRKEQVKEDFRIRV